MILKKDYDLEDAFAAIEDELIDSMMRNMKRHKIEEVDEDKQWEMWQALQLKTLEEYKKKNQKKFASWFSDINDQIDKVIREANKTGQMDQETAILQAIKDGFKGAKKSSSTMQAGFFKLNERKLDALIKATTADMKKAEMAILRMANDQYRKAIFNAQVYANTGAGTYEKAVDMATKDMLSSGLNCVEYANGARHTLKDYADMAIRTASKRAYLQGEGVMRQTWGISTVILNKRGNPCPKCLPFCGKVLIDDVWSGGTREDGPYPLMSYAISQGLYHPRCKDSHTTYFEGVSTPPNDMYTQEEIERIVEAIKKEQKQQYAKRQVEKYERLAEHSLDKENKKKYGLRESEWKQATDDLTNVSHEGATEAKKKFLDVTSKWLEKAKSTNHNIEEVVEVTIDGIMYRVDGINVKHNHSKKEMEVAELIKTKLGGEIKLIPEVKGKYKGISTPDYYIDEERWDLKELKGESKDAIRNAVSKKKKQADNFIIDTTECKLNEKEIMKQAEFVFSAQNTKFIKTLIIINDNQILRILKRK